ncbi:hypothetical protein E2C01_055385 [Portunus trituberculatus]|uniref:Uncharacterized protein n=1 Tax=Portunus trituberculatus TaxID=210409 RepID=A0A5B7GV53_PORTR|nr:hypothetical protein [Portunus trituberculatus]
MVGVLEGDTGMGCLQPTRVTNGTLSTAFELFKLVVGVEYKTPGWGGTSVAEEAHKRNWKARPLPKHSAAPSRYWYKIMESSRHTSERRHLTSALYERICPTRASTLHSTLHYSQAFSPPHSATSSISTSRPPLHSTHPSLSGWLLETACV